MQIKTAMLIALSFIFLSSVKAQDKINKKDGDVISAIIKEVGVRNIIYKRADNADGPEYIINKSAVEKIVYKNGTEDSFDDDNDGDKPKSHRPDFGSISKNDAKRTYGRNILSVMPLVLATDNIQGGAGFGVSYERILDKNGIVSLYLPFMLTLINDNQYNNGYGTTTSSTHANYYAMPGIKIYPTGAFGTVRYAVGPSLFIGNGTQNITVNNGYNPGTGTYVTSTSKETYTVAGFLVNNSLNISPTNHLTLGMEFGLGASYYSNASNYTNSVNPLVQFNFKLGYRF